MNTIYRLNRVVAVVRLSCPYSRKAMAELEKTYPTEKITYIYIDKQPELYEQFKKRYNTVPQIFIDNEYIGGYDSLMMYLYK